MIQANLRPADPPMSREKRLAAALIKNQCTTSHYNTLSHAYFIKHLLCMTQEDKKIEIEDESKPKAHARNAHARNQDREPMQPP
jgi:hypothetical protein